MKFIRDTLWTFSAQVLSVIAGIGSSVAVARALGPDGKGMYALVILMPTILVLLGNLGIGQASAYFGGTKRHDWSRLASNSLVSGVLIGLLLVLGFLLYYFLVSPSFLADVQSRCVMVSVLAVPFSLVRTFFNLILLGQGRIRLFNVMQVVGAWLSLPAVLVALLVLKAGVFGVVVAWTTGVAATAIVSVVLVTGTAGVSRSFSLRLLRDSVRFGVPVSIGNVIQFMNYRVDMIIIASLLTVTSVGYYSVSVAIAEVLWYLPSAIGTVVFSRTTRLSAEEANRATPRICRNALFVTAVAGIAIAVLGRYLIRLLFGAAFLPALGALWILLPGVVALSLWKVLPNDLVARGKTAVMPIGAGVSLGLNVVLNLVLIPRMGISGAALASTISYGVTALVVLVVFLRISRVSWVETIVLRREDLTAYFGLLRGLAAWMRLRSTVLHAKAKGLLVREDRA